VVFSSSPIAASERRLPCKNQPYPLSSLIISASSPPLTLKRLQNPILHPPNLCLEIAAPLNQSIIPFVEA
ncbi:unnamed protein product, partial [Prunus brigantina]